MYSAIITRYHGATHTLPSRISVSAAGYKRRYYAWDYDLNALNNHIEAAHGYAAANGFPLPLNGGAMDKGYAFTSPE